MVVGHVVLEDVCHVVLGMLMWFLNIQIAVCKIFVETNKHIMLSKLLKYMNKNIYVTK